MNDNKYDTSKPSTIGYSIIHGFYIDLKLWKPQSRFWQNHIDVYKSKTKSDIFPTFTTWERGCEENNSHDEKGYFSTWSKGEIFIKSYITPRVETVGSLAPIFVSDALFAETKKLYNNGDVYFKKVNKRANKQLKKYLEKLCVACDEAHFIPTK